MARKLIDLSMPVHNDMVAFPRVVRPSMAMFETWQQFAERIGAAAHGVGWLTASCIIVMGDHIGTHIDSLRHLRDDAPGPEGIPLEYCYGDGVCLDFRLGVQRQQRAESEAIVSHPFWNLSWLRLAVDTDRGKDIKITGQPGFHPRFNQ